MSDIHSLQSLLQKHFEPISIQIVDEKHLHTTHLNYQSEKAYLRIIMTISKPFNRLSVHREILKMTMAHLNARAIKLVFSNRNPL